VGDKYPDVTCNRPFAEETEADVPAAACVTDPASSTPGFSGGTIYVNGTQLTVPWSQSTLKYQCALFTVDPSGIIHQGPAAPTLTAAT
jgi:hypothetical protein